MLAFPFSMSFIFWKNKSTRGWGIAEERKSVLFARATSKHKRDPDLKAKKIKKKGVNEIIFEIELNEANLITFYV